MASIAVIGGTGALGKGIARRLVKAGHDVTIGSRSASSAKRGSVSMAWPSVTGLAGFAGTILQSRSTWP